MAGLVIEKAVATESAVYIFLCEILYLSQLSQNNLQYGAKLQPQLSHFHVLEDFTTVTLLSFMTHDVNRILTRNFVP